MGQEVSVGKSLTVSYNPPHSLLDPDLVCFLFSAITQYLRLLVIKSRYLFIYYYSGG